jgi:hypothetical protein
VRSPHQRVYADLLVAAAVGAEVHLTKKKNREKTQYIKAQPNRTENKYVRFEVFTAVTMKKVISWDVTTCGSCKKRCFEGMYHLHHQNDRNKQ